MRPQDGFVPGTQNRAAHACPRGVRGHSNVQKKNGKRAKQVRLEKAGKLGRGKLTIEGESGGNRCDEGKNATAKNVFERAMPRDVLRNL